MENTRRKRYNSCSMSLIPPAAVLIRADYPSAGSVQTVTHVQNFLINVQLSVELLGLLYFIIVYSMSD